MVIMPRGASWTAAALCRFLWRTQAEGERNLLAKDGRCRPDGAEGIFGLGFYKDVAPTALEKAWQSS